MSFLRFFGGGAGAQATSTGLLPVSPLALTASTTNEKIEEKDDLLVSNPDSKQFGMENFGNTCYANSVLQALYFCPPFRDLVCATPDPFREDFPAPTPAAAAASAHTNNTKPSPNAAPSSAEAPQQPTLPTPPTLFSALRSLYLHISTHQSNKGVVSPTSFITKLRKENELFRGPMHQDAHEFLNYLLNKIVEDLQSEQHAKPLEVPDKLAAAEGDHLANSVVFLTPSTNTANARTERSGSTPGNSAHSSTSSNATLVQTLFEGTLTNETRCLTCETVSSRDESFLDLSIDIEQNSSVTACLRQFSASEMLCQKNKFFCDSCCSLQEAEKRMKIKVLPNVLALHLKRFKLLPAEDRYVKLAYRVAFPLELRLFNTVDDAEDPDRLYKLFAIVVHIGGGPHHGHYITIVKSYGSVWRVFDDTNVSTIQESDIHKYFGDSPSGAGYVLFYQAADLVPEALGLPPKSELARTHFPVPASATTPPRPASIVKDSAHPILTPMTFISPNGLTVPTPIPLSATPSIPSTAPSIPRTPSTGSIPHSHSSGVSSNTPSAGASNAAGTLAPPSTTSTASDVPRSPKLTKLFDPRPHTPDTHLQRTKTPNTPHTPSPALTSPVPPVPNTPSTTSRSFFGGGIKSSVFSRGNQPQTAEAEAPPLPEKDEPREDEKEKDHHKDKHKSGPSWFRTKRKESLPTLTTSLPPPTPFSAPTTASGSQPLSAVEASGPPSAYLPDVKPRSSKRPVTADKLKISAPIPISVPAGIDALPIEALSPQTTGNKSPTAQTFTPGRLPRPKTAPGSGSPTTPTSSSAARSSFDRGHHGGGGAYDSSIPPVPPLPSSIPPSTVSSPSTSVSTPLPNLPPPPEASSAHKRRKSLSKTASNLFGSRPKSGDMSQLLPPLPPSASSSGQSFPSQETLPPVPDRHPRRTGYPGSAQALFTSANGSNGTLPEAMAVRPRPVSGAVDSSEQMYVIQSSSSSPGPGPANPRLAMSASASPSTSASSSPSMSPHPPSSYPSPALSLSQSTSSYMYTPPTKGSSGGSASSSGGPAVNGHIHINGNGSHSVSPPLPMIPSSASPLPMSPLSPTSTPSSKRASRKMSLSGNGSFFGGWGKDKDKDKEKDKERDKTRDRESLGIFV